MQFSVSEDIKSIVKCLIDLSISFEEHNKILEKHNRILENIDRQLEVVNENLNLLAYRCY